MRFLIFLACFFCFQPVAQAQETPWQSGDYLQARLVSAVKGVGNAEFFPVALELKIAAGWHIYWRTPGDAGLAPALNWDGSTNVAATDMKWPAPARFEMFGMQSFGYKDTVLFPVIVTPREVGKPVALTLKADIMVCKDICVPQDFTLALSVPGGAALPASYDLVIKRALGNVPQDADNAALSIQNVVLGPEALVVNIYAQKGIDRIDMFVEAGDLVMTARPQVTPGKDGKREAMLRIAKPEGIEDLTKALTGRSIVLTLTDGEKAIEKKYPF